VKKSLIFSFVAGVLFRASGVTEGMNILELTAFAIGLVLAVEGINRWD